MASDLSTVRAAIEQAIALWTDTPIKWPGEVGFVPPDDEPWLEVRILWGDSFRETMDGQGRVYGIVDLMVAVPTDYGHGPGIALADGVRDLVSGVRSGDVDFGFASAPQDVSSSGRWTIRRVSVRFDVAEQVVPGN